MKVTFKTGSEVNYGSINGEMFFASDTKQLLLNGVKYIPKKLSELTNDSGFLTSITKSMVENVLTGNITSHTHSYLPLSGGTLTGSLTCNGSYINMNGASGAKGYRGYFNNSKSADRANGSHIFQSSGWAYGENATSIGLSAYAGIRNTDSDSETYPYLHWQWMDCLQVQETTSGTAVNCYGAILTNAGGVKDTATFSLCIGDMCVAYGKADNSEALNNFLSFTNTGTISGRVVVYIADNKSGDANERIFGGTTSRPRSQSNLKIGNVLLGQGCNITDVASMSVNGVTVYRIAFYFWSKTLSANYDITQKTTAMVCTKVNNTNYSGASSYASGSHSVASGYYSVASGAYSVASGAYSVASGSYSVASGYVSVASGSYSVASGYASVASGNSSVASGAYSVASGNSSVASGAYSVASGSHSVASGNSSVASGYSSVASGYYSVASGKYSVASGYSSVASGYYSVASGYYSVASGAYSVASGNYSVAKHEGSKVYALRGVSGRAHQTVFGRDNVETSAATVVVGWGTSDTDRKNIFVLDTAGNATFGDGGTGIVTAATFSGALSGNAASATKLANQRTIKVGGTSRSFDGSADISFALDEIITNTSHINVGSISVTEDLASKNITINNHLELGTDADVSGLTPSKIGAAAASHTHSYLPLSGGTMSNANLVTNLNADLLDGYNASSFGRTNVINLSAGQFLRIDTSNFRGFLINIQGPNSKRNALYFITGYYTGSVIRSDIRVIKNGPYDVYFNGASEMGCAYIVTNGEFIGDDKIYINPFGYDDVAYTIVSSVPSDAVLVSSSNSNILATLNSNVASASKLGTSTVGSASLPIYLNNGTATACTGSSLFSNLSNSGNNISMTIAGVTKTLEVGYAANAGNATKSSEAGMLTTACSIKVGNTAKSFNGTQSSLSWTLAEIGAAAASHTHTFASLTGKPTTLSGYGITDAYTKTETNTELGKYLSLTGGTLNGALTVPKLASTEGILLGDSSLSAMVGSIGIQRYDETGFIGFLKDFNLDNSFNGVVLGWDGNYSLQENSVRIDASTFTYKGNNVWHSGNLKLGYISSGLSRAVQKDASGNLFIVAPSLFEQGISNNYPKNLRWSNETEGQLVYDTEIEAGNFDTVEIGIPLADGTSKGFLKSTSEVTNVTGYTPCPVVSGTPYYKEDCLYLGSTEIGYTGIMEYGIQYTYNYGTKLPYLEDYTPDSIPRCVVLCFPDRSSNYRFLFWLSAFDEGDPYIARFYNSAYETWLTIDTASRQIILSYGNTWQS